MDEEQVVYSSFTVYSMMFIFLFLTYIIGIQLFNVSVSLTSLTLVILPFVPLLFFQIAIFKKINKKFPSLLFIIGTLLFAFCMYRIVVHEYESIFTTEKWLDSPSERVKIVDDLLADYDLIGYSKSEITKLLGTSNTEYFKEWNNKVYYLGDERGFISIDSEWLVLWFDQGQVIDYEIVTD